MLPIAEQMSDEQMLAKFHAVLDEARNGSRRDIDALRAELKTQIKALQARSSRPPGSFGPEVGDAIESLGSRFVNDVAFQAWRPQHPGAAPASATFKVLLGPFDTKAAPVVSAGVAPITRLPGIVPFPVPPAAFIDVIGWRPISSGSEVDYLRQTAAISPGSKTQILEGDLKAEQTVTTALIKEPILTLASWCSASVQALTDLSSLQTFLDLILVSATRREIDRQTLVGVGPPNELKGIVSQATAYTVTLTQAGDTILDVFSHAGVQLQTAGTQPNVLVLNPADAEKARLIKTTYGEYILGDPSSLADTPALWGVRVVVDSNMTAGQFLIGQSATCEILDRQESSVMISFEHADYFTKNLAALRCEARVGLGLYVPTAWVHGNTSGALLAAHNEQPQHAKR
jgi:hypothetical protein